MTKQLDPQNNICCLIAQLEHSLSHEITSSLGDVGITPLQLQVLAELSIEPGLSTADLARYTRVTPQNMSLAVWKLIRKGFITRGAHATNRRIHRLDLTKRGDAVFNRAVALAKKVEARVFGGLSARERKIVINSLQRSLARLEEAEPSSKA